MAEKVTIMKLKVDLECEKCYKKVKKLLGKYPQIRDQKFDEKENIVFITVVCCSPEKIRDKLCYKGGGSIKSIEILEPPKPKPAGPEKKEAEKPKAEPEKKKDPEKPKADPPKAEKPKTEPEKKKDGGGEKPKAEPEKKKDGGEKPKGDAPKKEAEKPKPGPEKPKDKPTPAPLPLGCSMLLLRATKAGPLGLATSTVGPCSVTTVTMQGPFTIVTVEADPVMGTVVINISAKRIHKDAQLCDNYIHGVALLLGSVAAAKLPYRILFGR
ncbi:hypothetical protein glysoja_015162 [Glycine soja]|nr:hypothetical protein glysoja_015162 [Glycine soja]